MLEVATGVALILFAVRYLRKGLIKWAGPSFDHRLAGMLGTRLGSTLAGLMFGLIAPSSTTQSALAANLVSNKKISPENILAFLLWANLGISATIQLISLKVSGLYPLPLTVGAALFLFSRHRIPRALGQCVFAFGLVFLAMSMISQAAAAVVSDGDMSQVLQILSRHPILLFVFAAIMAFALQSSMAILGAFFAVSYAGAIGLSSLLPAVMGATVGIGITTLVTCWSVPGPRRRLATVSLLLKILVCAPLLAFLPSVIALVSLLPVPSAPQAALFHAALNFTIAVLATMIGPHLRGFFSPPPPSATTAPLDYTVLRDTDLALACASRETLKMGERVRLMYESAWVTGPGAPSRENVVADMHAVEVAEEEVSAYVSRMDWKAMNPPQREIAFGVLNFASHLSVVADLISSRLRPMVERLAEGTSPLDASLLLDTGRIREMVARRLDMSTAVLASRDPEVAKTFLELGSSVKREAIMMLKKQYEDGETLPSNALPTFASMVSILRRISGQLNTIGHTFAPSLLEAAESSSDPS